MFVRWKRKKLANSSTNSTDSSYSLYAVLVKSERIDGQPRQKVIKYLAHIQEAFVNDEEHRIRFWRTVDDKLQSLELTPEVSGKVEQGITRVVSRPTLEHSNS